MAVSQQPIPCPECGRIKYFEGICMDCRHKKERVAELALTDEEVRQKQDYVLGHIEDLADWNSEAYENFRQCLCGRGIIDAEVQRKAARKGIFYPKELYYHAPEDVRELLLKKLKIPLNHVTTNHIISSLAMQGDEEVLAKFVQWQKMRPFFWKNSNAGPAQYAMDGNWSFDEAGNRVETGFPKCVELEEKEHTQAGVRIGKIREDTCPHCGGRLADMLTLDGEDERLRFLGIQGKMTATCCPNCVSMSYGVFGSYLETGEGTADFPYPELSEEEENYMDDESYQALEKCRFTLSGERPTFYGADSTHGWEVAKLGGFAFWIQGADILDCPCCGKPMKFLAQLPWDTITKEPMEGTLYVEVCTDCRKIGFMHQQT